MAEYGEWTRKGATLSDASAAKEYGVDLNFIEEGIRAGKLEYRDGAIWGNPYLRLLRSELERYIIEVLGADYLLKTTGRSELRKVKLEMAKLNARLAELQTRKTEIETALNKP